MLFCRLLIFFEFSFNFQNILSGITSRCQRDWIQIRPDILSGLIWVQSVCKSYEQTTLVGNELNTFITFTENILFIIITLEPSIILKCSLIQYPISLNNAKILQNYFYSHGSIVYHRFISKHFESKIETILYHLVYFYSFPASYDFCRLLMFLIAYIANNMDPDQTAPFGAVWSGFIVFASMIKSSLKCTWKYTADVISRQHFRDKNIGGLRVYGTLHYVFSTVCLIHRKDWYKNNYRFTLLFYNYLDFGFFYQNGTIFPIYLIYINISPFSIDLSSWPIFVSKKDSIAKQWFLEYSQICHPWAVCLILFSKFVSPNDTKFCVNLSSNKGFGSQAWFPWVFSHLPLTGY